MSVSTPTLTLICCALAVPQASRTARAVKLKIRFIDTILPGYCRDGFVLDAEIIVQLLDIGVQLGIGEPVDNTAVFHDVIAIGNGRSETEILFHQQDGEPLLFQ